MRRRVFLSSLAAGMAAVHGARFLPAESVFPADLPAKSPKHIPRYRGFNIQWERRPGDTTKPAFEESDFAMMQSWGSTLRACRSPIGYGASRPIGRTLTMSRLPRSIAP